MNMSFSENKKDKKPEDENPDDIYDESESGGEMAMEADKERLPKTNRNRSDVNKKTNDAHKSQSPQKFLDKQMKRLDKKTTCLANNVKAKFKNFRVKMNSANDDPREYYDDDDDDDDETENDKGKVVEIRGNKKNHNDGKFVEKVKNPDDKGKSDKKEKSNGSQATGQVTAKQPKGQNERKSPIANFMKAKLSNAKGALQPKAKQPVGNADDIYDDNEEEEVENGNLGNEDREEDVYDDDDYEEDHVDNDNQKEIFDNEDDQNGNVILENKYEDEDIYDEDDCDDSDENEDLQQNQANNNCDDRSCEDNNSTKVNLRSSTVNKSPQKDQVVEADTSSTSSDWKVKKGKFFNFKRPVKKEDKIFQRLITSLHPKSHDEDLSKRNSGDNNSTNTNDDPNGQNLRMNEDDVDEVEKHEDSVNNVKSNQKVNKGKDKEIKSLENKKTMTVLKQFNKKVSTIKRKITETNRSPFHSKVGYDKNKVGNVGKYPQMKTIEEESNNSNSPGNSIRFTIGEKCLTFEIPLKNHMPDLEYAAGDGGYGKNKTNECLLNSNTEDVINKVQENGGENKILENIKTHSISPSGDQRPKVEKITQNEAKENENILNGSKQVSNESEFEDDFYEITINTKRFILNLKFTNKTQFPIKNLQRHLVTEDKNDNDNNNQKNINNSPDEISSEINPGIKKQRIESVNDENKTNGEQIEGQGSETIPHVENVHPLTTQPNPNDDFNETL